MAASAIEWTDSTWNPVSGCTRVSSGCDLCYAVNMTRRLAGIGHSSVKYAGLVNPGKGHFNGKIRVHPNALPVPFRWTKPRRVFVNSMSDLFHPGVPEDFVAQVFDVMERAHEHVFQILTKRPERAVELAAGLPWPPNVLFGTSVEDARVAHRIDALRAVPAAVRFISAEPLIGSVGEVNLEGVHWVIAGGESGAKARLMRPEWARELRDQCTRSGVAYFFKQWGRYDADGRPVGKKRSGRLLDGRTWDEHPPVAGFSTRGTVGLSAPRPLTDAQWARIEPVLPGRDGTPGGRARDNRAFVEGVRWKAWTGRPWRDLPPEYGRWNTVAIRVDRWRQGGHWSAVCDRLGDRIVSRFVGI